MSASGLRKTTPVSMRTDRSARQYGQTTTRIVSRVAALRVSKRAASGLGLKAAKIALIDQLFAFSKPCDWENPNSRPIVWPSNETLARRLGICISTLKHHLHGLVQAGLISYSDHPTYQRSGRRDADGKIIEAYGIDLSPIAMRFDYLSSMAEHAELVATKTKNFNYRRTILRKEIRSIFASVFTESGDCFPHAWQYLWARLEEISDRKPSKLDEMDGIIAELTTLRNDAEDAFDVLHNVPEIDTALSKFRPLQTTTDKSNVHSCNAHENPNWIYHDAQKSSSAIKHDMTSKDCLDNNCRQQGRQNDDAFNISLSLIQNACPNVREMLPDIFINWQTLRGSAAALCKAATINPQVWLGAQQSLGEDLAISALALTVEKASFGLVTNPSGYLKALVQRASIGELYISRSLFALTKQTPHSRVINELNQMQHH
ncbi:plasmid replication protein RepC [Phyllobacterium sp. P30BS-XVII]|uniref:plasmid replication protein RepC n=1 Tax=Phyllobacterium sp. P30BS-XVII TaxID=2587046 RepID=UPI0015FB17F7|nr:plasmid replication protein RepC [Phyllobacterium sp. P30BS-XVII]MBA8904163.1 replication initiation protein RepC [Phyllobacterium sp. P30BS-XVII]